MLEHDVIVRSIIRYPVWSHRGDLTPAEAVGTAISEQNRLICVAQLFRNKKAGISVEGQHP